MPQGRLREIWREDRPAYGVFTAIPSSFVAEQLALTGFDFIIIDCQHGLIGHESMIALLHGCARAGTSPIVRVAGNDPALIGAALDAGADGVIVPGINSVDDARRALRACRYPPEGVRSFGPIRSAAFTGGTAGEVNEQLLCIALIESRAGVAAAGEICALAGVDGALIGHADLAVDMSLTPGVAAPELDRAIASVIDACRAAGKVSGRVALSPADVRSVRSQGVRFVVLGADFLFLQQAAAAALEDARRS